MNDKSLCTEDGLAGKTLCLKSLPTDLKETHLSDYFSTFGPLQSVRIHDHTTDAFGLVKFEGTEAAANALKMKHHVIDGRMIEVEIADDCHQDQPTLNDEVPVELTNLTGTRFMDLDYCCLRQILNLLSAMDLCSMWELADQSKNINLKDIAITVFKRKFRSIDLNTAATTEHDIERLLLSFGSLMYRVITKTGSDSARTINFMLKCRISLQWLTLRDFKFDHRCTWALEKLFINLKYLDIYDCHFNFGSENAFASCQSLESLTIYGIVPQKPAILQHTFPKLTSFSYYGFRYTNKSGFMDFISRHKGLTSLRLNSMDDDSFLLPVIAANCTKLRALEICPKGNESPEQWATYARTIPTLQNLEILLINADPNATSFISQLKYLESLRALKLQRVPFNDGIVTALTKLNMLHLLVIETCEGFTNFNALAKMTRLKQLHIISKGDATFDKIEMISRLADLKRLSLKLKTTFEIDDEMQSSIVATRSKSGMTNLTIVCNGIIKTHLP